MSKSRQTKFERQAKKFFKTLDPNPSPKEIREAQSKGKQVSESLWTKILKLPTFDQNNLISMNNLILQNISPFPNTSIVQTAYHAWRKIWIHDCKTFIKNHTQILEWFEKGFIFRFSIMKHDIRFLKNSNQII